MNFCSRLRRSLLLFPAALLFIGAAGGFYFQDTFDDNDISDWDVNWAVAADSPLWLIQPPYHQPAVESGIVTGLTPNTGGNSYPLACMSKRLDIDASDYLRIEIRTKTRDSQRGMVHLVFFSDFSDDYDGYYFHWDPHTYVTAPRVRLYKVVDRDKEIVGSYDFWNVPNWNTYLFERDGAGNWTMHINGDLIHPAFFQQDDSFNNFSHVGLMVDGADAAVDWIRIRAR
ncbi:hypothetical protein ACFLT7_08775 [candidate division KSB1 bacterium]